MGIVPEAREARVFHGGQPASGHDRPVQAQDPQAATREVGLQHQGVVAGAKNDAVPISAHRHSSSGFVSNRRSSSPSPRIDTGSIGHPDHAGFRSKPKPGRSGGRM